MRQQIEELKQKEKKKNKEEEEQEGQKEGRWADPFGEERYIDVMA